MLKSRKHTCLECHLYAVYGYDVPTHCDNHKYEDMYLLTNTKCAIESCTAFTIASTDDIKNIKCYKHNIIDDTNDAIDHNNVNNIFDNCYNNDLFDHCNTDAILGHSIFDDYEQLDTI
jgi:hypothetical protein